MLRKALIMFFLGTALIPLEGCTRTKVRKLSQRVEALETSSSELRSRADALEARLQNAETLLSQQHDLATRVIGKWSGISVQSDPNGRFREVAGQSLTFSSDGTLSQVRVTGLGGAVRFRVLNANALLFSFSGGRQLVATNVEMQGNRLSFLLGSAGPVAVVLTRS
ncbi:MAG: hypothetical protein HYT87_10365 [Nitrospirae bacterium]|nr:hypothetical protein [Nitrospirota bacterium]